MSSQNTAHACMIDDMRPSRAMMTDQEGDMVGCIDFGADCDPLARREFASQGFLYRCLFPGQSRRGVSARSIVA